MWYGGGRGEPALLRACYDNAFRLGAEHQVRSIAFPAISTGVYGYPIDAAAVIALTAMRAHAPAFDRIIACCFSETDADIDRRALDASG